MQPIAVYEYNHIGMITQTWSGVYADEHRLGQGVK